MSPVHSLQEHAHLAKTIMLDGSKRRAKLLFAGGRPKWGCVKHGPLLMTSVSFHLQLGFLPVLPRLIWSLGPTFISFT
jgi:hypothetical protein